MSARSSEGYQTPIPKRDIEHRSTGSGPVTTYQLSPEELERYRSMPVGASRDINGIRTKKPIPRYSDMSPEEQRRRAKLRYEQEDSEMKNGQVVEKFIPEKVEFLKQIALGKSINKLEKEWGMNTSTLFYYVNKWGLKGIKPELAQQLLDEMAIDGEASPVVRGLVAINEQLNQKEALTSSTAQDESTAKAEDPRSDDLIRQLQSALERISTMSETVNTLLDSNELIKRERDDYKQAALDLESKVENNSDQLAEIYRLTNDLKTARDQSDADKQTIEDLESDRQVLLATIEQASAAVDSNSVKPVNDPANHPAHYTAGGIECIDAIEAATTGLTGGKAYATGAAIKYLWRWSLKNGAEDLKKARWYVDRLLQDEEYAG